MICRDAIHTKDKLYSWGISEDSLCCRCSNGIESIAHVFNECHVATEVWKEVRSRNQEYKDAMDWDGEMLHATSNYSGLSL